MSPLLTRFSGNGSQAWIFDPSLRAALLATLPTYNSETRWADEDDFDEEELDEDDVDEDYRDDDHNEENVDGENLDDDHLEEEGLEDEDIDESDLDEDAFFEFEPPSRSSSKDNFRKKDDGYDGDECDVDTSGGAFRAQAEEQPLTGKKQLDEYDSELRKTTLKKDDGTMIQKDQLAERDSEMKDTTSANVLGKKQYKRGRRGGAREREKKARKIELGLIDPDATPEEAAKRKPKAEDKAFRKNASKIRKRTGHEGKVVHGMTEGGAARKRIQRGKKRGSANKGPSGTREKEPTVTVQTVARKPVDRICVKGEDPKMEEGFRDAKAAEQSVNLCR